MGKRVVYVGLDRSSISEDELEELLAGFEERVRSIIEERARRRLDEMDIVVEAEYGPDNTLNISLDVRVTGRLIAPHSYDELVAEAIEEAAEWFEQQLRAKLASRKRAEADRAG